MSEGSSIGRSVPRLDGGEKVTGLTRFAGDLQLPVQVHARLVLSPHAHARIVRIDGCRAAALPGVLGVFGAADLAQFVDATVYGRLFVGMGDSGADQQQRDKRRGTDNSATHSDLTRRPDTCSDRPR